MPKKKRGRPKNIKVHVRDLLDYLEALPDTSLIKENLTPDRMILIKRYIFELEHLDKLLDELRKDIEEHGTVELFVQGTQQLRRANPSVEMYNSTLRTYRALVTKINELIKGLDVVW